MPAAALTPQTVSGGPLTYTLDPDVDFLDDESCTVTILAAQVTDTDTNDPHDNMASNFVFSFDTGSGTPGIEVLINEVDADNTSTDSAEFVELYDGGLGNSDLSGLVLVFFNGSNDASYRSYDLDGQSTDANGYFVLCGNAANVANCDLDVSPSSNLIQNGADAVALYSGDASDFPNGTAVTTTNILDAIVYDTSDGDDAGLLVLLNADQPQVNENNGGEGTLNSNQRCPDGGGGARNTYAYVQLVPTPGAANGCPPPEVVINEIIQNPAAVSDASGEWFEVYNPTIMYIDMNGWTIADNDGDSHVIDNGDPLLIPAGGYLVFGINGRLGQQRGRGSRLCL